MTLEQLTIEELLDKPIEELEAITDEQMTAALSKYFIVTRPENVGKEGSQGKIVKPKAPKTKEDWDKEEKTKAAFELAKKMGINLRNI